MRLTYLILLILTNILTAFSTTVITDPYQDLDYSEPLIIDFNEEKIEDNPCSDYSPIEYWRRRGD